MLQPVGTTGPGIKRDKIVGMTSVTLRGISDSNKDWPRTSLLSGVAVRDGETRLNRPSLLALMRSV